MLIGLYGPVFSAFYISILQYAKLVETFLVYLLLSCCAVFFFAALFFLRGFGSQGNI